LKKKVESTLDNKRIKMRFRTQEKNKEKAYYNNPILLASESLSQLRNSETTQNEIKLQNGQFDLEVIGKDEGINKYYKLFEFAPFGYITIDKSLNILESNLLAAGYLGYEKYKLSDKNLIDFIDPIYKSDFKNFVQKIISTNQKNICTIKINNNEKLIFLQAEGVLVKSEDSSLDKIWIGLIDITMQKKIEILSFENEKKDCLELEKKDLLLKEINHRVKNNFQIVSSLLSLKSRIIDDPKTSSLITDCQNRIRTFAIIHDKLYRSENLSKVCFSEYVTDLVNNILTAYEIDNARIKTFFELDEVYLGVEKFIPCGLIINELITNAVKHAFPNNQKGEIYIILKNNNEQSITLSIKDNGVPLASDFNINNKESLGLQLVSSLVDQMHGVLTINKKNCTEFKVTF